jgi:hypothetical protein
MYETNSIVKVYTSSGNMLIVFAVHINVLPVRIIFAFLCGDRCSERRKKRKSTVDPLSEKRCVDCTLLVTSDYGHIY